MRVSSSLVSASRRRRDVDASGRSPPMPCEAREKRTVRRSRRDVCCNGASCFVIRAGDLPRQKVH
eukprot:5557865-Prymnesium_polylepis.2